jgi:hypothetical protein
MATYVCHAVRTAHALRSTNIKRHADLALIHKNECNNNFSISFYHSGEWAFDILCFFFLFFDFRKLQWISNNNIKFWINMAQLASYIHRSEDITILFLCQFWQNFSFFSRFVFSSSIIGTLFPQIIHFHHRWTIRLVLMEHSISQLSYTNIDYLNWYCIGIGIVVFSCVNCIGIGPKCQYCSTVISIALIVFKGCTGWLEHGLWR